MATLNKQFLSSIGVELDDSTVEAFSLHFEDTLTERVIEEVIDTLEGDKLEELISIRDNDDNSLQTWLQQNVPDLTEIINQEVAILIGEIAENSDQI